MSIRELLESGDKEAALKWCDQRWEEDPDSDEAAFYFANLMCNSDHPGIAKWILEELTKKHPRRWQAWQNLGYALNELGHHERALKALKRAAKINPDAQSVEVGLSSCYTNLHRWGPALKHADRALERGESLQAEVNKAFTLLCTGRYGEGWDLYGKGVGRMPWRDRHEYGLRDGIGAGTLIYAEQGIGDQIAFCSALPDAIRAGKVAAVNCHPKLETLFRDSFPGVEIHGDQFVDELGWLGGLNAEHQAPMSWLMREYRRKAEDFPRRPFLKANTDKRLQWRVLLDMTPKPKIGIAWNGGVKGSHGWRRKCMDPEMLRALMDVEGVEFVSLEYRPGERPRNLLEWSWGTQTSDYSYTAALVAELDAVIGVPTSVHHLAGALGVPSFVLVHERPHFHYAAGMPYYDSVTLFSRSEEGVRSAKDRILEIASNHPGRPGAREATPARDGLGRDRNALFDGTIRGGQMPRGGRHARGNGAISGA